MSVSEAVFRGDVLKGQTALVTGGATGIGFAIAQALGTLGADLVIASRKEENLKRARDELAEQTGRRVEYSVTNIRDYPAVESLYAKAEQDFGKLDIVVNNAGGQFAARFEDISINGFRAVVETNLMGTFHSCKAATEQMKRHGGGRIINIVNDYCFDRGAPEFAHSGAARSGVVNLSYTLALEMAPYGINVNVISPGLVASRAINTYYTGDKYGDWLERCAQSVPAGRFGEPDEVAAVVVFLASPAAAYISGIAIRLDGGGYLGNIEFAWPEKMRHGAVDDQDRPQVTSAQE
jgi:NAD(P)-dependent dehydrogenase (short-subunit alcohol dehydrogenase family)